MKLCFPFQELTGSKGDQRDGNRTVRRMSAQATRVLGTGLETQAELQARQRARAAQQRAPARIPSAARAGVRARLDPSGSSRGIGARRRRAGVRAGLAGRTRGDSRENGKERCIRHTKHTNGRIDHGRASRCPPRLRGACAVIHPLLTSHTKVPISPRTAIYQLIFVARV